jgi:hypothetical protein
MDREITGHCDARVRAYRVNVKTGRGDKIQTSPVQKLPFHS